MSLQIGVHNFSKSACAFALGITVMASIPLTANAQEPHKMDCMSMPADSMKGISMTGDVDFDFAVNMRKHHQMALVMAEAQLKNGKDAKLRKMATQIIAAQKKEIAVLDRWIVKRDRARASQSAH